MLKASFITGLIGGIFGIITGICGGCAGICGSAIDSSLKNQSGTSGMDAGLNIGVILIILSVVGIVGAALVQKKKIVGSILQALYPVIGFISIMAMGTAKTGQTEFSGGTGLISFALPALLFAVATILGFLGKPEEN